MQIDNTQQAAMLPYKAIILLTIYYGRHRVQVIHKRFSQVRAIKQGILQNTTNISLNCQFSNVTKIVKHGKFDV